MTDTSAFRNLIENDGFPCVGAKSAAKRDELHVRSYGDFTSAAFDKKLLFDLDEFIAHYLQGHKLFLSFVAIFDGPRDLSEQAFEKVMWARLQALHRLDHQTYAWDQTVSDDPNSHNFSFSLRGTAFFIIGLHPNSSRKARQFEKPTLVFNLHDQFERLREDGRFDQMRDVIRERDIAYSGEPNPVLDDFGSLSEARQYSGRAVGRGWRCPFVPESL